MAMNTLLSTDFLQCISKSYSGTFLRDIWNDIMPQAMNKLLRFLTLTLLLFYLSLLVRPFDAASFLFANFSAKKDFISLCNIVITTLRSLPIKRSGFRNV